MLTKLISESCQTLQSLAGQEAVFERIATAAVATLRSGGKILTCGNGGSAADALHLAEELVGRYRRARPSWPAICLSADPTLLTCIANDYGFEAVFARQVEGLASCNDLLICFTSSGNSANIVKAIETARKRGVTTVALLGKGGGVTKGKADMELIVEGTDTARIQEAHGFLVHELLERIEREMLELKAE